MKIRSDIILENGKNHRDEDKSGCFSEESINFCRT